MLQNRRTVVVSVVSVLFAAASAVGATVNPAMYRPDPVCGDYVEDCPQPSPGHDCRKWYDCRELYEGLPVSQTTRELGVKTVGLTAAIAAGKMDKVSHALDGLFSGSGAKSIFVGNPPPPPDEGVVVPGDRSARRLVRLQAGSAAGRLVVGSKMRVPSLGFRTVACGDADGCRSETGKIIEDAVKPISDALDRLGDYLRDRNDDKLGK